MSLRTRAREVVLQLLYQDDLNKDRTTDEDWAFIKNRLHNQGKITEFARELLDGVRNKRSELDQQLSAVAENWKLGRMAATDRNVLRLGAFEILYFDTPAAVAINEAIEIAKRYGNHQSSLFINGILDRLLKKREQQGTNPTDPSEQTELPATINESDVEETEESDAVAVPLVPVAEKENVPNQTLHDFVSNKRSSKNDNVATEDLD